MSIRKMLGLAAIVVMINGLIGCAKAPQKVSEADLEGIEEFPAATKEAIYPKVPQPKETRLSVLKEKIKEHLPVKKIQPSEKVVIAKAPPRHVAAAKDIQKALKNSGYYTGNIDGKIGSQTTSAIKAFQKDSGLKVDGVVGQRTWNLLSKYLTAPSPVPTAAPPLVLGEKKPGGVVTITKAPDSTETITPARVEGTVPSTTAEVSSPSVEAAGETPPFVEEAPVAERNFTPLIVIVVILLGIILAISIYRRRRA